MTAIKEIFENMILTLPILQLIESGTLYTKGDMTSAQMELCHEILQSYRRELEKGAEKNENLSISEGTALGTPSEDLKQNLKPISYNDTIRDYSLALPSQT